MPDGCAALPKAHTHHTSTTAIRRRTGRVARPHVVDPRIPRSHSRSISGHTSAPTHTDCSHPQPHTHNSKNAHPRAHASPCRVHFTRQPSGCLARAARIVVASCDRQPSVGGGLRGAQVLQALALLLEDRHVRVAAVRAPGLAENELVRRICAMHPRRVSAIMLDGECTWT